MNEPRQFVQMAHAAWAATNANGVAGNSFVNYIVASTLTYNEELHNKLVLSTRGHICMLWVHRTASNALYTSWLALAKSGLLNIHVIPDGTPVSQMFEWIQNVANRRPNLCLHHTFSYLVHTLASKGAKATFHWGFIFTKSLAEMNATTVTMHLRSTQVAESVQCQQVSHIDYY